MEKEYMLSSWDHTSAILAMLYNANRDPKKTSAGVPEDFNPYREKSKRPRREPLRPGGLTGLAMVWGGGK